MGVHVVEVGLAAGLCDAEELPAGAVRVGAGEDVARICFVQNADAVSIIDEIGHDSVHGRADAAAFSS